MALTALDFPASPTNGQLYPDPPVTGQPQYAWNGAQWLSSKAAITQIARTDALGWSGMQINGSMEVSQELGSTARTTNGYVVDGWQVLSGGSQAFSSNTQSVGLAGISKNLNINITTANSAPASGDYLILRQSIEAYRTMRLDFGQSWATPMTIGFWTAHHRTGTYSGSVQSANSLRTYAFTYIQSAVDTWEYKTVTIPPDITGTWERGTNLVGMMLNFAVALGSSTANAPNVWTAANFFGATGTTNGMAATSDIFRITGVVVLPGIEAPTAAQSPLIMRPFDQELVTCQRYFEYCKGATIWGYQTAGGAIQTTYAFKTSKRATPTLSAVLGWDGTSNGTGQATSWPTLDTCVVGANAIGTGTMYFINMSFNADARL